MLVPGHRDGVDRQRAAAKGASTPGGVLVGEQAEDRGGRAARPAMTAEEIGDGARGGGIVGAVEPEFGLGGQQIAERARRRATAAAPASPPSASPALSAASGTSSRPGGGASPTASAALRRLMRAGQSASRSTESTHLPDDRDGRRRSRCRASMAPRAPARAAAPITSAMSARISQGDERHAAAWRCRLSRRRSARAVSPRKA